MLTPFIDANKSVFNAEYKSTYVSNASTRNAMCSDTLNRQLSTLVLALGLDDSLRLICL